MTMFSGDKAHPMGVGPYVLASDAGAFEVQACHQAVKAGSVISRNTAVAAKWTDATGAHKSVKFIGGEWSGDKDLIECTADTCTFPNGARLGMAGSAIWVRLPPAFCAQVGGLCGNYNPDAHYADAYTNSTGQAVSMVGQPMRWGGPYFGQYQSEFADSWKATAATSLFSVAECPVDTTPLAPAGPEPYAECPELQQQAIDQCPDGPRYEECLMDVGVSCELTQWVADAQVTMPQGVETAAPTAAPTPPAPTKSPTPLAAPCPTAKDSCAAFQECNSTMRCSSSGDPHIRMFSGKRAHPQGEGTYVLSKSQLSGGTFEVQACHRSVKNDGRVSVNSGVAVRSSRYGTAKYLDATRTWEADDSAVTCSDNVCAFPSGERVAMRGGTIQIELPGTHCGHVMGVCGNFTVGAQSAGQGVFADAFTSAQGALVDLSADKKAGWHGTYQQDFVESYHATGAASLFTDVECPSSVWVPPPDDDEPFAKCPDMRALANDKCPTGARHNDCVMDVGMTCTLGNWVRDADEGLPLGPDGTTATPTATPTPSPTHGCDSTCKSCVTASQRTSSTHCATCHDGYYLTHANTCLRQTTCPGGQQLLGASTTSAGTCENCPGGTYKSGTNRDSCSAQNTCPNGQWLDGESTTNAGACKACPGGKFKNSGINRNDCSGVDACHEASGQYEYEAPSATRDRTCRTHSAHCGSFQYQSKAPDNYGDRECAFHPVCGAGKYLSATSSTSAGTCENCADGKYQGSNLSRTTSCVWQTTCGAGKYLSATSSTQGTCENCQSGRYKRLTSHRDSECTAY
eukprot:g7421.t1